MTANTGTISDVNGIVLNNMTLANSLTVVAGGAINGTGIQNVGAVGDYTSTGLGANGNILLMNEANQFGSLRLVTDNGSNIRVVESDATMLGDVLAANATASIRSGGAVSQLPDATIQVAGLAVVSGSSVTLTNANQFTSLAVEAQSTVNIAVTNAPGSFLTIGSVDGVNGITTGAADVSIRADRVMVSSPINTAGSNNAVSFTAWSATTNSNTLQIGGTAAVFTNAPFFVSGLNNVNARVVRIGSTNSFGANINIGNSIQLGTVTNDSRTLSLLTANGGITQNSDAYVRVNSLAMFARSILMTPLEPNCNDFLHLAYGGTTLGAADVTIFYEFPGAIDLTSTIEGLKIEPDNLDKIIDDCGKGINRVPTGVYYIAPFAAQQLFYQAYGVEPIPLGEGGDESLFSRGGWGPRSIWTSYLNLPFLGYEEKEFRLEDVPNWIIKDESKWPKDPKGEKFDEQSKPQANKSAEGGVRSAEQRPPADIPDSELRIPHSALKNGG